MVDEPTSEPNTLEFHIYTDQPYPLFGGYIECPVCHNHMKYYSIKDTTEWCEPFYTNPRYVITETTFHLNSLYCDTCKTQIDNMYVVANEKQTVIMHDARNEQS